MFIPRTLATTDGGPGKGALARAAIVAAILAVALFAVLSLNVTPGQVSLEVGDRAAQDIRAPRDFSFQSRIQTEQARADAAAAVGPVYEDIRPPQDIAEEQLEAYERTGRRVTTALERRDAATLEPGALIDQLDELLPALSASQVQTVAQLSVAQWQDQVVPAGRVVLEAALAEEIPEERVAEVSDRVRGRVTQELPAELREIAGDLAASYVVANQRVSEEATEQARQAARSAIDPVVVSGEEGDLLVADGDEIGAAELETLEQLGLTQPEANFARSAGHALIASLVAVLLVAYLWRFQPEIWYRNRSLLLFVLALLVTAVTMRIAADRTVWPFVVPTSATILLIAILLGGSAGAAMLVTLTVLVGILNQAGVEPAVYVLAGGLASLVAIVNAERLNAFVRAGALLAVTNIAVVVAFSLLGQRDVAALLQLAGAGVVNAGLSVSLALGSFALLGNLFGIMTVFQLLELANPSNRLLRRLLLETPGTYHHSVMVGNLAERAAETIGADPLLARVAAYYHDIGKMKNPLAFIENQAGSRNIHDDLTAETSARIIAGHIRDGIDLGYEHGLPVQIIGFIPQHHGTSVMSYFHGKALREVGGRDDQVSERDFRYPGPKPQSREAAILMLADGVEASVRSLDDKDEPSIRAMVDRIVDGRVEDGQLDDAELTLKNIRQIKEAFVQQLLGMYHSRIKYPDNVLPLERREQA